MEFKEIHTQLNAVLKGADGLSLNAIEKQLLLNQLVEIYEKIAKSQAGFGNYSAPPEILVIDDVAEKYAVEPTENAVIEKQLETIEPKTEVVIENVIAKEPEIIQQEVTVQKEVTVSTTTLLGKFENNDAPGSLNERFLGQQKGLNETIGTGDLKKLIDFNKQFVFINELFKNDSAAFQSAIDRINQFEDINQAFDFVLKELATKYNWDMKSDTVKLFDKTIRQKFGL